MMDDSITRADIIALQQQIETMRGQIKEIELMMQTTYASKAYIQTYIENVLGDMMPTHDPFTQESTFIGYELFDIERIIKHFQNLGGSYTIYDYRVILLHYDAACARGNINPYIAVAQMVKETDWGRSWWSQRPRRNPAGIGVTGETSQKTQDKNTWAFDHSRNIWKKGYSFPTWEVAAQAHIGHLLAYAYTDDQLTTDQTYLVAVDPRAPFIPKNVRGKVKLLKDLDGKWAVPGLNYGKSIATLANVLKV